MKREAGLLLHISSLPSKGGIGTLGKEAYDFVDFLVKAKLKIWQVLPLVPTSYGDSPYQSVCSTALNYYFIDYDILKEKGLLKASEYNLKIENPKVVDYNFLFNTKLNILNIAFKRFSIDNKFLKFVEDGEYKDFAVFMTLKKLNNYQPWYNWNNEFQEWTQELEDYIISNYKDDYLFFVWTQYEFLEQWNKLHNYAKINGINIMGDMPLYVSYDSVEVWKHKELFLLDENKKPTLVAGCPPDCFSEDGQLWGNPIYDWRYMQKTNYSWWNQRIKSAFNLYDILRIDHFRGFDKYYAIPYGDLTAKGGWWEEGPSFDFFKDKLNLNIVAEDLGLIDDGVRELMRKVNYPGMKVLEFAFDGNKDNDHKPSNFKENVVVYTGTHDNMPLYQYILDLDENNLEIFKNDLKNECLLLNVKYRGRSAKTLCQTVVELAFASKANTCIIPIQDLLGLDGSTRMNFPSTLSKANWSFRMSKNMLKDNVLIELNDFVDKYIR